MKDTPSASGMPSVGALLDLLTVADNPVDRPHTNTNTDTITNTHPARATASLVLMMIYPLLAASPTIASVRQQNCCFYYHYSFLM